MADVKSVLFVCTGNSCRSVMAEGLLKKYLSQAGRNDVEVRSAGIAAIEGLPPTEETIEVLRKEDINVSESESKRLDEAMVREANLILVMEEAHRQNIIARFPEAAAKAHLLKKFGLGKDEADSSNADIPDPIGRPMEDYIYCLKAIKRQIERIVKLL